MKGSKMPPTTIAVNEDYAKTEALKYHYQELYSRWKTTLQPCEISESELEKIEMYITKNMSMYMDFSNPIDITDIVSAQVICTATRCDGECIECNHMSIGIKFKQPKQVDGEIEAVAKEAMQLMILDTDIEILEEVIEQIQNNLTIKESKLNQLKERKQSLLNNLNTDNNK